MRGAWTLRYDEGVNRPCTALVLLSDLRRWQTEGVPEALRPRKLALMRARRSSLYPSMLLAEVLLFWPSSESVDGTLLN